MDRIDTSYDAVGRKRLCEIEIVNLSKTVLAIAENFKDLPMLGSLDAIHLATAMLIKEDNDKIITYDKAMTISAESLGFVVVAPN